MKIFHDSLGTHIIVLAIQNVSKCIAIIEMAKNVSANNCGNDRCYAEIRNAPAGAYKPTVKQLNLHFKSTIYSSLKVSCSSIKFYSIVDSYNSIVKQNLWVVEWFLIPCFRRI